MNLKNSKGPCDGKSVLLSVVMLAAVVLLILSSIKPVSSLDQNNEASETVLVVRPFMIMNHSKVPNEELNLNITAINTVSLHGFELKLSYNAALVNCTSVQEGDLLGDFGNTTSSSAINNT